MTQWLGDYAEDATVHFQWSTNDGDGASVTRTVDGEVRVYKDNGVAQSTAGVTDTEDFDGLTGIHACTIDLSADAFYTTGADYSVVLAGATIDGQTVNAVLAHFSIENRFDEVDVVKIGGGTQSATDLKDFADAGYDPATNKVQGVVLTDTCTTLTGHTAQTGDNFARLGAPAAASVSADILAVDNFVDELESRLTAARAGYLDNLNIGENVAGTSEIAALNDLSAADVNAEVDTALADIDLDHFIQVSAGAEEPTDGSYLDQIMHKDAGQNFDAATDSLEAIRDTAPLGTAMRGTDNALLAANVPANFDVLSITAVTGRVDVASIEGSDATDQIRDSVVDDATRIDASALNTLSGHSPDNTIADVDNISGLNNLSAADVNAEVDTALADIDLDHFIQVSAGAEEPTDGSYLDQIMHKDAGQTFDASTDSLEALRDTDPIGTAMRGTDNAALASVCTEARLAELDAANIPADVDAILTDTAEIGAAGAGLTAVPWNASWDAEVQSEVQDALEANDLDHFIQVTAGAEEPTDGSYLDQVMHKDAGQTFDASTDSLEAIRDRGDAAWLTGGAGAITDILNIQPLIPESVDLADTATWRLGLMLVNSIDDLPSTAEITPGTVDVDRKAIGGTSWSSIVSGAACLESAGLIYYDEVFDSGTGYAEGDSIRVTFKSQKITVAANDYEISDATGRIFYTEIRQASLTAADVNAEMDTALADIDLDHLIQVTAGSEEPTDGSYLDQIMHKNASQTFDAATDSLEAISDKLATSTVTVTAVVSGSTITLNRGDTLSAVIEGLGTITGYVSLDFTVKYQKSDTDANAIVRIRLNASDTDDGLLRLNGQDASARAANGSITIDDAAAGNITVALAAAESDDLAEGSYVYDIQRITATGVNTMSEGTFTVTADVTRLIA